ncbi:MAG: hypothetical protein MZV63_53200 [Marinilabiliales bacterium]|nr:hypothetical protein [Marinilabiliales bacterium]
MHEDAVTNGVETLRFSSLMVDKHGYRHMEELGTHADRLLSSSGKPDVSCRTGI